MRTPTAAHARLMRAHHFALLAISSCGPATFETDAADALDSTEAELTALRRGVNSTACRRSPYNCQLHPGAGGQRVTGLPSAPTSSAPAWPINPSWLTSRGYVTPGTGRPYVPVVDGHGELIGPTSKMAFVLNYGQTRHMGALTYVFALDTGLRIPGWVPVDAFLDAALIRQRVGEVNAHGAGLKRMACYEFDDTYPARLDHYKVVKGATDKDSEEPNDYLPHPLADGRWYSPLCFSVPGAALGAPSVDLFPAGTRFQRLDVPTWESAAPSLNATLYAKPAGSTAYTQPAGSMKFVYGYVKTKDGTVRYGWTGYDGLKVSSGCPSR